MEKVVLTGSRDLIRVFHHFLLFELSAFCLLATEREKKKRRGRREEEKKSLKIRGDPTHTKNKVGESAAWKKIKQLSEDIAIYEHLAEREEEGGEEVYIPYIQDSCRIGLFLLLLLLCVLSAWVDNRRDRKRRGERRKKEKRKKKEERKKRTWNERTTGYTKK